MKTQAAWARAHATFGVNFATHWAAMKNAVFVGHPPATKPNRGQSSEPLTKNIHESTTLYTNVQTVLIQLKELLDATPQLTLQNIQIEAVTTLVGYLGIPM